MFRLWAKVFLRFEAFDTSLCSVMIFDWTDVKSLRKSFAAFLIETILCMTTSLKISLKCKPKVPRNTSWHNVWKHLCQRCVDYPMKCDQSIESMSSEACENVSGIRGLTLQVIENTTKEETNKQASFMYHTTMRVRWKLSTNFALESSLQSQKSDKTVFTGY
jgi:hypothetical protein